MGLRFTCITILLNLTFALPAQEFRWGVGMDYFFDNMEYKPSTYADARTLQGIWLNAMGGMKWDSTHTLVTGVNLLKIPGMHKAIDKADVTLYYQYDNKKVHFRAGAFPRNVVLPNYSDFFFRDSVNQFMPLMQGLFWQLGKERNFFNAWMDWTGYAHAKARESFFLGFSGKVSRGIFFADFQSTLYHLAGNYPNDGRYGVSEVIQGIASTGVELSRGDYFQGIASVGVFAGVERDRKADQTYRPIGFTARLHAEYMGVGTENNLYVGDSRMRLFNVYRSELYWGNPFLQGSSYLQSKWYIRLLEFSRAKLLLNCNLHLSEGHLFFQQALALTVQLGNLTPKPREHSGGKYPWMHFFNKRSPSWIKSKSR